MDHDNLTLAAIRASLPSYPIELNKPDIACWQTGNTGIDYVHSIDSGVPGPHVMVNALTHGNEICGAIALDTLLRAGLRPCRGRLTFSFANIEAFHRFEPTDPDAARYVDEDMNRLWSEDVLDGPRDSLELRRARELRPLIDTVDFLFDIHSMHEKSEALMLTGPLKKGIDFALGVGAPIQLMVDAGHAAGKRLRDYGGFSDPASPKNALLIECGQHFEQASREVALDATCRFLLAAGVVEGATVSRWMTRPCLPVRHCLRVTHAVIAESTDFRFIGDYHGMEVIPDAGTLIAVDGERRVVTPYGNCVLLQPSLRHLGKGVTVVRLGFSDAYAYSPDDGATRPNS